MREIKVFQYKNKKSNTEWYYSFYGRSEEARTPDILLPKQARYQLRYTPKLRLLSFFEEVRRASCCNIVVSLAVRFAILLVAPLLIPRFIRHRRRSETSPTALHPERYLFFGTVEVWTSTVLVPVTGVEPVRYRYHWILSPARLPIPSHRQILLTYYIIYCLKNQYDFFI